MPILALLVVSAFWGAHAVVGKAVESGLSPTVLTVWRFTFGLACYLPWFPRFKQLFKLPRRLFWQMGLTGLCLSVLYPLFYYQSLRSLPPVESLLLVNTAPMLAALFGFAVLGERLSSRAWVGIVVAFLGVIVILAGQWSASTSLTGVIYAGIAAICFAAFTVLSRSLFRELPLFDVLLGTSAWGVLLLWGYSILTGNLHDVAGALTHLSASTWVQFLYIVIIVSTVSYVFYGYGLRHVEAGIASALTIYPQVIFAAILQWVWLGLVPTVVTGVSACLILGGTYLMRRGKAGVVQKSSSDGVVQASE